MEIIKYQDKYKNDFIQLNLAWIERFYKVEQSDIDMLEHIDEHIQNGAMVYFAIQDNIVLATCMIEPPKIMCGKYASWLLPDNTQEQEQEVLFLKPA